MFFGSHTAGNAYQYFVKLIEQNMDLFGSAIEEKLDAVSKERMTDDEFVACYVEGMHRVVEKLHESVSRKLESDAKCLTRYLDALEHPNRCGFRFQSDELTIGKVYLYYIWGKTRKKAPKSDCIKLEKYAVQLIGKQCLKYGIVQ